MIGEDSVRILFCCVCALVTVAAERCDIQYVNVTVTLDNSLASPRFYYTQTLLVPQQPLKNILLMAAAYDQSFRFETQPFETFGEFITGINGIRTNTFLLWDLVNQQGQIISTAIDKYIPRDGDVLTFVYRQGRAS